MAYSQVKGKGTTIYGRKMDKMITVANDLAKLNGTTQQDAKKRGDKPALILTLLKNKLVTKDEYITLYKDLLLKQTSVVKNLKNADPAARMVGGAAARAAHFDMKSESVNEGISKDDIKIEKSMTGFYNILVWNKGWQLFSKHRLEGMGKEVMKAMNSRKGMKYVEKLINKQNQKSSSEIIAKKSEKNGIARLIGESLEVNEIGQFPIHNYIQGIIPTGYLDTHTPQKKKQSVKLVSDLKKTLNTFWKSHDIPYRIK